MITNAVSRRVQELIGDGAPFVTATVVLAQRPTSAKAGDVALILADGTIEGFVGGVCAQNSVRVYALQALASGDAVLLRILPDGDDVVVEEGAVTVQNTCLSGGGIEIFLDPVLPAPRVVVVGDSPVAEAIRALGGELRPALVDGGAPRTARAGARRGRRAGGGRPGRRRRRTRSRRAPPAPPRARSACAVRRARREQAPRLRRARAAAHGRRLRAGARARRCPRRARHRLAHAARDRAVDPRRDR